MFTGIIEEVGTVQALAKKQNLYVLDISVSKIHRGTKIGDSIAIDGACMTVTSINKGVLCFDVMKESLEATTLHSFKKGRRVNLERALKANSRLGGHFVSGHVDAMVKVKAIKTLPNYVEYRYSMPKSIATYIVPKGSITIDGISLTVGVVTASTFSVYYIPHTLEVTNVRDKGVGDLINVETDMLAKYMLKSRA